MAKAAAKAAELSLSLECQALGKEAEARTRGFKECAEAADKRVHDEVSQTAARLQDSMKAGLAEVPCFLHFYCLSGHVWAYMTAAV